VQQGVHRVRVCEVDDADKRKSHNKHCKFLKPFGNREGEVRGDSAKADRRVSEEETGSKHLHKSWWDCSKCEIKQKIPTYRNKFLGDITGDII
jgi:hypothetical protein